MATIIAAYKRPSDPAAFDRYYFEKHVPLAKTIPGLRKYEVSQGSVMGMAGPHDVYLVAMLTFDSMDAIQVALTSPEGQATAADLGNFATAGVDLMMSDTRTV
jgi:uncharacterized protein (TIGR02118 family)